MYSHHGSISHLNGSSVENEREKRDERNDSSLYLNRFLLSLHFDYNLNYATSYIVSPVRKWEMHFLSYFDSEEQVSTQVRAAFFFHFFAVLGHLHLLFKFFTSIKGNDVRPTIRSPSHI